MSFLAVITPVDQSNRPVDPGYGVEAPVDPGYGVRPPVDPGYGVPAPQPPVGIWPPVVGGGPITPPPSVWPNPPTVRPPGQVELPIYLPVRPDNSLPPGVDNTLPGGGGGEVDNTLPPYVDNTLPSVMLPIYPPLSPSHPIAYPKSGGVWILAYLPYAGWKYVKVDVGARPDNTLPEAPVAGPKA